MANVNETADRTPRIRSEEEEVRCYYCGEPTGCVMTRGPARLHRYTGLHPPTPAYTTHYMERDVGVQAVQALGNLRARRMASRSRHPSCNDECFRQHTEVSA